MAVDFSEWANEVWCEYLHRSHDRSQLGAGLRRPVSRGALGSRRLVMLIFAGCPGFGEGLSGILFIHLEPFSNSLGDACSGWDFPPALTLTRHRGLATVTCRLRSAPSWIGFLWCVCVCVCFLPVCLIAVPLEPSL